MRARVAKRHELARQKLPSGNYPGFQAAELLYRQILAERDDPQARALRARMLAQMAFEFGDSPERRSARWRARRRGASPAPTSDRVPGHREARIYLAMAQRRARSRRAAGARRCAQVPRRAGDATCRARRAAARSARRGGRRAAHRRRRRSAQPAGAARARPRRGGGAARRSRPRRLSARARSQRQPHRHHHRPRAARRSQRGIDRERGARRARGRRRQAGRRLVARAAGARLPRPGRAGAGEGRRRRRRGAQLAPARGQAARRRCAAVRGAGAGATPRLRARRGGARGAARARAAGRLDAAAGARRGRAASRAPAAGAGRDRGGGRRRGPRRWCCARWRSSSWGARRRRALDAEAALRVQPRCCSAPRWRSRGSTSPRATPTRRSASWSGSSAAAEDRAEVAAALGQVFARRALPDRARSCFARGAHRDPLVARGAPLAGARCSTTPAARRSARGAEAAACDQRRLRAGAARAGAAGARHGRPGGGARRVRRAVPGRDADLESLLGAARAHLLPATARGAEERVRAGAEAADGGADGRGVNELQARALLAEHRPAEAVSLLRKVVPHALRGEALALLMNAYLDLDQPERARRGDALGAARATRTGTSSRWRGRAWPSSAARLSRPRRWPRRRSCACTRRAPPVRLSAEALRCPRAARTSSRARSRPALKTLKPGRRARPAQRRAHSTTLALVDSSSSA